MWKTSIFLFVGGVIFFSLATTSGANPLGAAMATAFLFWLPASVVFLLSLMAAIAPSPHKTSGNPHGYQPIKDGSGQCPNCAATLALNSSDCSHCRAIFDGGSNWKVLPSKRDDPE
jgi:hypothetical protein